MQSSTVHRITLAVLAAGLLATAAWGSARTPHASTLLPIVDGTRVKTFDTDTVYLVDSGELRPMRYAAYKNLFRGWTAIGRVAEVPEEMLGDEMTGKTRLVRVKGERHIWMIDNGKTRRHVREWLDFSQKLVEPVSWAELQEYPEGAPIGGPAE